MTASDDDNKGKNQIDIDTEITRFIDASINRYSAFASQFPLERMDPLMRESIIQILNQFQSSIQDLDNARDILVSRLKNLENNDKDT